MKNKQRNEYWYDLPEGMIAQAPASPRDSSKLLIYNTQTNELKIDYFYHLATSLPPSTTLTLNDAKVVPARVVLTKETGGKITVLFLVNEWIIAPEKPIPCFLDRKARAGDRLYFKDKSYVTIQRQEEGLFFVSWNGSVAQFLEKLSIYGTMPIPPYIKHSPLTRDELMEKYQTIFAKNPGSSAAPTASLHFTPAVFDSLEKKGIEMIKTTLHVGLGTFAPLTQKNLAENKLHAEWYEITKEVAQKIAEIQAPNSNLHFAEASRGKRKICAVGTTVVRTLESYARQGTVGQAHAGNTELFIRPGFQFRMVDMMITNFHLPSSSLMMLVDAFLAHKGAPKRIIELYEFAKKNKFRFYSFGDAMLIF